MRSTRAHQSKRKREREQTESSWLSTNLQSACVTKIGPRSEIRCSQSFLSDHEPESIREDSQRPEARQHNGSRGVSPFHEAHSHHRKRRSFLLWPAQPSHHRKRRSFFLWPAQPSGVRENFTNGALIAICHLGASWASLARSRHSSDRVLLQRALRGTLKSPCPVARSRRAPAVGEEEERDRATSVTNRMRSRAEFSLTPWPLPTRPQHAIATGPRRPPTRTEVAASQAAGRHTQNENGRSGQKERPVKKLQRSFEEWEPKWTRDSHAIDRHNSLPTSCSFSPSSHASPSLVSYVCRPSRLLDPVLLPHSQTRHPDHATPAVT